VPGVGPRVHFSSGRGQNHQDAIMSRQDANAAFALSSFLQGTNATYIDDIYARYEKDPGSVDPECRSFSRA
jgi:2-oxoglutarate dehydrogenase E1 component